MPSSRSIRRVLHGHVPDAISCFARQPRRGRRELERAHADPRLARHAERRSCRLARAAARCGGGARPDRRVSPSVVLAGEARLAGSRRARDLLSRRVVRLVRRLSARRRPRRASRWHRRAGCSTSRRAQWDEELLGAARSRPQPAAADRGHPGLERRRCSNAGTGCTTRERAALMVGTSGALRVLYASERPQAQPSGPLPLSRRRAPGRRGRRALGRRQSLRVLERTLADAAGSLCRARPARPRPPFLPFLGGERSTGLTRTPRHDRGLDVRDDAAGHRQAAYEGVAFRFAAIADLPPRGAEVVATGGRPAGKTGCIQTDGPRARAARSVSGVAEASLRGAAVLALERAGHRVAEAPIVEIVEPRADRADATARRGRTTRLYHALT